MFSHFVFIDIFHVFGYFSYCCSIINIQFIQFIYTLNTFSLISIKIKEDQLEIGMLQITLHDISMLHIHTLIYVVGYTDIRDH